MPIFMVERDFAEQLELSGDDVKLIDSYESNNEIKWITSFLSADKKKTYCLYEVEDADILRRHAADLGLPADSIMEVSELTR